MLVSWSNGKLGNAPPPPNPNKLFPKTNSLEPEHVGWDGYLKIILNPINCGGSSRRFGGVFCDLYSCKDLLQQLLVG